MSRLKINLEAIERDGNNAAEGFSADGGVRVGSLLVSSQGVRDSAGHSYALSLNDFDVVPESEGGFLGRGSSGSVRCAVHRLSNTLVALKEIKVTGQGHISEIRRELETLHAGDCVTPYLVNFYGAFTHEGSVYIAMEAMDGSLQEVRKPVPLPVLASITRQMLKGLLYLHRARHLMHRDLKPSNVLFNGRTGDIKISDFGVSSFLECTKADAHSFVGTVTYMSPERLHGGSYSYSADIWSLGLLVAELAIGVCPFAGLRGEGSEGRFWALIQYLSGPGPALKLPPEMDESVAAFINACVVKVPESRASCAELLRHPFILKYAPTCESAEEERLRLAPSPGVGPSGDSGTSSSPVLAFPAARALEHATLCGAVVGALPASSTLSTTSSRDRQEGEPEEDFLDRCVMQQWMRSREGRLKHRHRHRRHHRNVSPLPAESGDGDGSGSGRRADELSTSSHRPLGVQNGGLHGSSSGSESVTESLEDVAGVRSELETLRTAGEPSVNLDDELNKLLF